MKKIIRNFSMLTMVLLTGIMFSSCNGSKIESSSGGMSVLSKETGEYNLKDYSAVVNGKTIIPFGSNVVGITLANGCFIVTFRDDRGVKLIDFRGNNLLPQYNRTDGIDALGSKYFAFEFPNILIGDNTFGICDAQGKIVYEPESVLRGQSKIELLDDETAVLTYRNGYSLRAIDLRNGEIIADANAFRVLYTTPLSFLTVYDQVTLHGRERTYNLYGRNGSKKNYKRLNSQPIGSVFTIDKGQNFINYYTPDKQYVGYIDLETGVEEITEEVTGWGDEEI